MSTSTSSSVPVSLAGSPRLRLASLKLAAPPTQQQLVDYVNACNLVSGYVYGITNTQMPPLSYPPSWYGDYNQAFAKAKGDAMRWTNDIVPLMMVVPQSLIGFNAAFQAEFNAIVTDLSILIQNPNNPAVAASLASTLQSLLNSVRAQNQTLTSLQQQLAEFSANLGPDAQTLQAIASNAQQSAGDDQQAIDQLTAQIAQLQADIRKYQKLMTAGEIGGFVSFWVGLVGVALTVAGVPEVGVPLLVVGVAGTGAGIALTVVESQNIKAAQANINGDLATISGLDQDIVYLNSLSTEMNQLVQANYLAQQAITVVQTMWSTLEADLQATIDSLTTAQADVSAQEYHDAMAQVGAAESSWADVEAFAQAVAGISYEFNPSVAYIPAS